MTGRLLARGSDCGHLAKCQPEHMAVHVETREHCHVLGQASGAHARADLQNLNLPVRKHQVHVAHGVANTHRANRPTNHFAQIRDLW